MKNGKVFIKNGQPYVLPVRLVDGVLSGYVDGNITTPTQVESLLETSIGSNIVLSVTKQQPSDIGISLNFDSVVGSGVTTIVTINPNLNTPDLPANFVVGDSLASFSISSTANFSGEIVLDFYLPESISQQIFNSCRIFRVSNGQTTDSTVLNGPKAPDFSTKRISALVNGFSEFYIIPETIAPTPTPSSSSVAVTPTPTNTITPTATPTPTATSTATPDSFFIEYLVVAGGGGAGGYSSTAAPQHTGWGGGGGAGGLLSGTINSSLLTTVSIGTGGIAGQNEFIWKGGYEPALDGINGSDSSLGSIVSIGGGGGGGPGNGKNGGSGGGGRGNRNGTASGGSGVSGQGYDGGSQIFTGSSVLSLAGRRVSSGGGGAGGAGKGYGQAGGPNSGAGLSSSITGAAIIYSPGGYTWNVANSIVTSYGRGGSSVGFFQSFDDEGGVSTQYSDLSSDFGVADFRNGSPGVVILAYPSDKPALSLSADLTYTTSTTSRPGYRVYTITSGSGSISTATPTPTTTPTSTLTQTPTTTPTTTITNTPTSSTIPATPTPTTTVTPTTSITPTPTSTPASVNQAASAPTNVTASLSGKDATVSFSPPSSDGGSAITNYIVQYSRNNGTSWTTFNRANSTATSNITVNTLSYNRSYIFRAIAVNSIGDSNPSNSSSSITTPPGIVGNLYGQFKRGGEPSDAEMLAGNFLSTPLSSPSLYSSIDYGENDDNYGFMAIGYFIPPTTGTYTFYTSSDDGSAVWVGSIAEATSGRSSSNMVVNNDVTGYQGDTERSGSISLIAGTVYAVRIIHREGDGGDNLRFSWAGPNISKRTSLATYFYANNFGSEPPEILSVSVDAFNSYLRITPILSSSNVTYLTISYSSDDGSSWTTFGNGQTAYATSIDVTGLINDISYILRVTATNSIGTGEEFITSSYTPNANSVSPVHLANGFLSALRTDTISDSEFSNAALTNGYLSVLRVNDTISEAEFPNAVLANGYLSVLRTNDTISEAEFPNAVLANGYLSVLHIDPST